MNSSRNETFDHVPFATPDFYLRAVGRSADSFIVCAWFPGFADSPRALCRRPLRGLGFLMLFRPAAIGNGPRRFYRPDFQPFDFRLN